MKTSERGRAAIASHEGVVLRAYRDVAGVLTIGVGHTARAGRPVPTPGMTITRADALVILARDLDKFESRVEKTRAFTAQAPFDGAVSFDFNTGAINRASWVRKYKDEDYAAAEVSLKRWNRAGGKVWKGLVHRRAAEADLIFRGKYPHTVSALIQALTVPATSSTRDDVRAYQRQLAALGYYMDAPDGVAGPATLSAVRAFQRAHPHLSEDGIVGPATRAALQRAFNARAKPLQSAGAAAAIGVLGAAGADTAPQVVGGVEPLTMGMYLALALLLGAGAFYAWRYRDEIKFFLNRL